MAFLDLTTRSPLTRPRFPGLRHLARMVALSRSRTALRDLDDRALADIGLTRTEARKEAARPAWDAPANWR